MATTTITIYHDSAAADATILEKMRPNGVPNTLDEPGGQFQNEYASKMQKFFSGLACGTELAMITTFISTTSNPLVALLTVDNATLVANDTFSIGGVTFTAKVAAAAPYEFTIGASSAATAANIVSAYTDASEANAVLSACIVPQYEVGSADILFICSLGPIGTLIDTSGSQGTDGLVFNGPSFTSPESPTGEVETVSFLYIADFGLNLIGQA